MLPISLGEEMATHASILAWRIPWTEEADELQQSMGLQRSDMTERLTFSHIIFKKHVVFICL